eukprot:COSAG04_NODE_2347_length_4290_cov_1.821045_8_plen_84_part_01
MAVLASAAAVRPVAVTEVVPLRHHPPLPQPLLRVPLRAVPALAVEAGERAAQHDAHLARRLQRARDADGSSERAVVDEELVVHA